MEVAVAATAATQTPHPQHRAYRRVMPMQWHNCHRLALRQHST